MSNVKFDTLKYVDSLREAEIPEEQARAYLDATQEAVSGFADQNDLKRLENKIDGVQSGLENKIDLSAKNLETKVDLAGANLFNKIAVLTISLTILTVGAIGTTLAFLRLFSE